MYYNVIYFLFRRVYESSYDNFKYFLEYHMDENIDFFMFIFPAFLYITKKLHDGNDYLDALFDAWKITTSGVAKKDNTNFLQWVAAWLQSMVALGAMLFISFVQIAYECVVVVVFGVLSLLTLTGQMIVWTAMLPWYLLSYMAYSDFLTCVYDKAYEACSPIEYANTCCDVALVAYLKEIYGIQTSYDDFVDMSHYKNDLQVDIDGILSLCYGESREQISAILPKLEHKIKFIQLIGSLDLEKKYILNKGNGRSGHFVYLTYDHNKGCWNSIDYKGRTIDLRIENADINNYNRFASNTIRVIEINKPRAYVLANFLAEYRSKEIVQEQYEVERNSIYENLECNLKENAEYFLEFSPTAKNYFCGLNSIEPTSPWLITDEEKQTILQNIYHYHILQDRHIYFDKYHAQDGNLLLRKAVKKKATGLIKYLLHCNNEYDIANIDENIANNVRGIDQLVYETFKKDVPYSFYSLLQGLQKYRIQHLMVGDYSSRKCFQQELNYACRTNYIDVIPKLLTQGAVWDTENADIWYNTLMKNYASRNISVQMVLESYDGILKCIPDIIDNQEEGILDKKDDFLKKAPRTEIDEMKTKTLTSLKENSMKNWINTYSKNFVDTMQALDIANKPIYKNELLSHFNAIIEALSENVSLTDDGAIDYLKVIRNNFAENVIGEHNSEEYKADMPVLSFR